MKKMGTVALILSIPVALLFSQAPAGVYGNCYYCPEGENPVSADSVELFLKRTSDQYVYEGNSRVNEPNKYVANNGYGIDCHIDAGYYYYVRGRKINYSGVWDMQYTGPHAYLNPNDNALQHIYLIRTGDIPDDK
jgi:hypothetical protein